MNKWIAIAAAAGLVAVGAVVLKKRNDEKENDVHRFATKKDFEKYRAQSMKQDGSDILLGRFQDEELGMSPDVSVPENGNNVLVIGGSGAGKTFHYLTTNLLQDGRSAVVNDQNGEAYKLTSPYLSSKGHTVYHIDTTNAAASDCYNPLNYVYDTAGEVDEAEVEALVNIIAENVEKRANDAFYDSCVKSFLLAIIYYVLECPSIRLQDRHLGTVLKKASNPKLLQEMQEWFEANADSDGKKYYDTFLIGPEQTKKEVIEAIRDTLMIFMSLTLKPIVCESSSARNISFETLAEKQSYLFVTISSGQGEDMLRQMLYHQLFNELYQIGREKALLKDIGSPALPVHVDVYLDEFQSIGKIKDFPCIMATANKYNVSIHCLVQSLNQIAGTYASGTYEVIIGCSDAIVFLGSSNEEDKNEMQKLLGKTVKHVDSVPVEVWLMSLDEIGNINRNGSDDELVILRGTYPFHCKRLNPKLHKRWAAVQNARFKFNTNS